MIARWYAHVLPNRAGRVVFGAGIRPIRRNCATLYELGAAGRTTAPHEVQSAARLMLREVSQVVVPAS
jgi:hypothetical protein